MKFSVVINTYNRGPSLRNTLLGLRRQTYHDFEVVVVNGPSTDDTEEVLAEFSDARVARCPEVNISKSRNVGIAEASGDIVAFIDDDGIPAATWLEELAAGFDSERIGGVGGIVYDHTGYSLQYSSCVCDRLGNAHVDLQMPHWAYAVPKSDKFVHLLGTNASFRRKALVEIGGFDEEIEYYLDETEVCMRLIDHGYWLRLLEGAPVYHKFLASHLRNEQKVLRKPFPVIKNKFYFSLQASKRGEPVQAILEDSHRFTAKLRKDTLWAHSVGRLKTDELAFFETEVERGIRAGIGKGLTAQRQSAIVPPANQASFRRFPTLCPERRLNVCFVSQEMPPETLGGIGRFTLDVAQGFAGLGHEVHLITRSPDHNRVDLEKGVWVHRLQNVTEGPDSFAEHTPTVRKNLSRAAAAHREVQRIAQAGHIDLVSAPVWDCEGLFCQMDDSLTTVLTLHTTLKTVVDMNPSWQTSPEMPQLLAMERHLVQTAKHLTAPSRNILAKVRRDYRVPGVAASAVVIPHGLVDRTSGYQCRRCDRRIRVLFVGRLEVRKGIHVLLEAATQLVHEFPQVEFVLVGDDTIPSDSGPTYRADFEATHRGDPACERVIFNGIATEQELYQHYADCDIFCLPARYESFGLVLLEAMMFAKPVVGCAAGGMTEVVEHGGHGFLALPDDVGSLIEHLRRLIESETLRREFGARSRQRFKTEFSADRMVRNTLEAYTHIIDSSLSVSRSQA